MASLERWHKLCSPLEASMFVDRTFHELVMRYREPDRAYHNLEHISNCLKEYDALKSIARNGIAVEYAIWFHDAIYDTHANNNEGKSAEMAAYALREMGIYEDMIQEVVSLILLTKHNCLPTSVDGMILLDVDLAILGQPAEVFDAYESGVRREYSWVSDEIFWSKRSGFLSTLLNRKHLFYTEQCRKKYELAARRNLLRSIRQSPNDGEGLSLAGKK